MKSLLLLVAILGLGLFFRVYSLSTLPNGLYWDEMDTGYQAFSLLKTGRDYFNNSLPLFPHSFADYRTPVFIYSAIPSVKLFGLSAESVRLPDVIWGMLGILTIYVLANLLFPRRSFRFLKLDINLGYLAALGLALSHWHLLYSRKSVETISLNTTFLVGLSAFLVGLRHPRWLPVSALFFGLATMAYSPGKLFVPLFIAATGLVFIKSLLRLPKKTLFLSAFVYLLFAVPVYFDNFFGTSGTRFRDVSILTDPTVKTEINHEREVSQLSSGIERRVGLSPRLVDKLWFNRPVSLATTFFNNYLSTFSTDFLFIKGDPEPRQSPGKFIIGQLQLVEFIPLILGLFVLSRSSSRWRYSGLILIWIALSPLPAALTREGGTHAARVLILLPALMLTIALGVHWLASRLRPLYWLYLAVYTYSVFFVMGYMFNTWRFESAKPYNWGFRDMVKIAITEAPKYDRVILDFNNEYALMAYLFVTNYDPVSFHKLLPLQTVLAAPGANGVQFGNVYLLYSGSRSWKDIFASQSLRGRSLIITTSDVSEFPKSYITRTVDYPDSSPAFYLIDKSI